MFIINPSSIVGKFILNNKNKIIFENNNDFIILLIEKLRKYKIKEYCIKKILDSFFKNNYYNHVEIHNIHIINFKDEYKVYNKLFELDNKKLYINISNYFIKKAYIKIFIKTENTLLLGSVLDTYENLNEKLDNVLLKYKNAICEKNN